jgi:hypothetical protein
MSDASQVRHDHYHATGLTVLGSLVISVILFVSLLWGAFVSNMIPVFATTASIIALVVTHFAYLNQTDWNTEERGRRLRHTWMLQALLFAGIPGAHSLLWVNATGDYTVVERGTEQLTYESGVDILFVGFAESRKRTYTKGIRTLYVLGCQATSADGRNVAATLNGGAILTAKNFLTAHKLAHSDDNLSQHAREALCASFAEVVRMYALEKLSSDVFLGSEMLRLSRDKLAQWVLEATGYFSVSNVTPFEPSRAGRR